MIISRQICSADFLYLFIRLAPALPRKFIGKYHMTEAEGLQNLMYVHSQLPFVILQSCCNVETV